MITETKLRERPAGKGDWRCPETYAPLLERTPAGWAEEWLRRNEKFEQALKTLPCLSGKSVSATRNGICATQCPHACPLLRAVFQNRASELHLLFREGEKTFQLVLQGIKTLDRPVILEHTLSDLAGIRQNIDGFEMLYALYQRQAFMSAPVHEGKRSHEQLRAMQALDGKRAGASHRTIASVIFEGDCALAGQWDDCYRSRTQWILRSAQSMASTGYLSLLGKPERQSQHPTRHGGG